MNPDPMTSLRALGRVRIVLVQTSHPGNIGAAARAMKTMGLPHLFLVRPEFFPHPDADAFAAGASDVLSRATVCDTLEDALKGTVLAVATTARRRDMSHDMVDCREACHRLIVQSNEADVAVVFGPERTGLTIRDVDRCRLIATIPTDPSYAALNLAQAVQVFGYELRMACSIPFEAPVQVGTPATHEQIERFYAELEQTLYDIRFLHPRQPRRMMQRLRRVFARGRLEKAEINILRGLLNAIRSKVE